MHTPDDGVVWDSGCDWWYRVSQLSYPLKNLMVLQPVVVQNSLFFEGCFPCVVYWFGKVLSRLILVAAIRSMVSLSLITLRVTGRDTDSKQGFYSRLRTTKRRWRNTDIGPFRTGDSTWPLKSRPRTIYVHGDDAKQMLGYGLLVAFPWRDR